MNNINIAIGTTKHQTVRKRGEPNISVFFPFLFSFLSNSILLFLTAVYRNIPILVGIHFQTETILCVCLLHSILRFSTNCDFLLYSLIASLLLSLSLNLSLFFSLFRFSVAAITAAKWSKTVFDAGKDCKTGSNLFHLVFNIFFVAVFLFLNSFLHRFAFIFFCYHPFPFRFVRSVVCGQQIHKMHIHTMKKNEGVLCIKVDVLSVSPVVVIIGTYKSWEFEKCSICFPRYVSDSDSLLVVAVHTTCVLQTKSISDIATYEYNSYKVIFSQFFRVWYFFWLLLFVFYVHRGTKLWPIK